MPARRPEYTLFVDESGNHDLRHDEERFLALVGVVVERRYAAKVIKADLDTLSKRFWPNAREPVVLHRWEILHRANEFKLLHNDAVRADFDAAVLELLAKWEYTVIAVAIDKKAHRERYSNPYHPYYYCLMALLERYVCHLEEPLGSCGDVVAEGRGGKLDRELEVEYQRFYANGTGWAGRHVAADRYQRRLTSRELKIRSKKANIPGLQLADLLAHEVRVEILDHFGIVPKTPHPFQDRVIDIIRQKYRQSPSNGSIDGWGRKLLR